MGGWKGVENVACDSVYAVEIKGLAGLFVITYKTA